MNILSSTFGRALRNALSKFLFHFELRTILFFWGVRRKEIAHARKKSITIGNCARRAAGAAASCKQKFCERTRPLPRLSVLKMYKLKTKNGW